MLRLCAILALIGVGLALEDLLTYEFTKDTCLFSYGVPIEQREEINDIQCVKACLKNESCTSLMYQTATRQCFLNAEILEDESLFPADCGVHYAAPVTRYFGCDYGWQTVQGRCFLYPDVLLNWHGCDEYCIGEGGYLARLLNSTDIPLLYSAITYGWATTTVADGWCPWMTVNDLFTEGIYTDRDGVPLHPQVLSTIYYNGASYDCGYACSSRIYMDGCQYAYSCLCEHDPKVITKRAKRFQ